MVDFDVGSDEPLAPEGRRSGLGLGSDQMAVLEDLDRLDGGEVGRARIMIFPGSSCREWLSLHTTYRLLSGQSRD